ncbi:MAG: hypothetical protein ACI97A_003890, partial [Planctomycetota bacterium]
MTNQRHTVHLASCFLAGVIMAVTSACSKSSEHSPAQSEIITHAIETTALDGSRVSRVGVSPNGKFY